MPRPRGLIGKGVNLPGPVAVLFKSAVIRLRVISEKPFSGMFLKVRIHSATSFGNDVIDQFQRILNQLFINFLIKASPVSNLSSQLN